MTRKKRAGLKVIIVPLILLTSLLIQSPVFAASVSSDPVAVDGRTLAKEKAGDTSAWIEIAQYGGYSLILRQEPLTSSLSKYSTTLGNNTYADSLARKGINDWYNNKLSGTAGLRDFAVTHDAMRVLGTMGTGYVDGISLPTGGAARKGNDVAFALSYCEAAFYCSTQYSKLLSSSTLYSSSDIAISNCAKLLPKYVGAVTAPAYWLRTPGNTSYAAGCVAYTGDTAAATYGRAYQHTVTGEYAHYRPALWVGSGIFGYSVTGKVWPMAVNDLGIGEDFIAQHKVTVELRPTFLTRSVPELSMTATVLNSDGMGEFTFTDVPAGEYILFIERPGYLTRTMKVSVSEDTSGEIVLSPPGVADNGVFNLWWGDSNGDLSVDGRDVMMIMELIDGGVDAFDPNYNAACDMNADGMIDGRDLMMVYEMWDRIIWDYPGAEDVDIFS